MSTLGNYLQSADWKKEKHAPVIDCPDSVKADEVLEVKVSIGKEIAHPNTTEHHISWFELYFVPEGSKFPHSLGKYTFSAHGESTEGPNQGPVYAEPKMTTAVKLKKSGVLYAVSFCNIHGLWENSKTITVE